MAFKFGLEQILKYRHGLEERSREELARKKASMEEIARRLSVLRDEREGVHEIWRKQTEREIDLISLRTTYVYLQHLGGKIERKTEEKKKSAEAVDVQRAELKKRWQDRRIMEMLKDRTRAEYREFENRREHKVVDELSLNAFARKRRPDGGVY
ncbi:MAG: flagellar export protein FliJ [Firmicutes bacterium]|nr:flagellar export protein FliJ [Bacillota bacterium]